MKKIDTYILEKFKINSNTSLQKFNDSYELKINVELDKENFKHDLYSVISGLASAYHFEKNIDISEEEYDDALDWVKEKFFDN